MMKVAALARPEQQEWWHLWSACSLSCRGSASSRRLGTCSHAVSRKLLCLGEGAEAAHPAPGARSRRPVGCALAAPLKCLPCSLAFTCRSSLPPFCLTFPCPSMLCDFLAGQNREAIKYKNELDAKTSYLQKKLQEQADEMERLLYQMPERAHQMRAPACEYL